MECPYCQSRIGRYAKRCERCGKAIPSGQYLLEESGLIEPEPDNAPPNAAAPPVRKNTGYRLARLGDRFIAFVLDTALLFGLFAVVDAWVFMRWSSFEGTELQLTAAVLLIGITLNAAILFLYGWLFEAACGATVGKALVGIRVVRTTQCSSLSACAVRNALRIVDGLGFYLVGTVVAACSSIRQRIGDICGKTAVIEESFGAGIRATAIVLWIAILAGAAWAVPRICSACNSAKPRYLSQVVVRVGRTGNSVYFRIAHLTLDVHSSPTP
jgi:uncharacterized RDD family membrane protein YckC